MIAKEHLTYWENEAKNSIEWMTPFHTVYSGNFEDGNNQWFLGGKLNMSVNCLDRHLQTRGNHPAIHWIGDKPGEKRTLTFSMLHEEVCRMSNVLLSFGIQKGDTVGIYCPLIPEAVVAMLACTRIGAIHTVVFAGFSKEALQTRLMQSDAKLLVTKDAYDRGGKHYFQEEITQEIATDLNIPLLVVSDNETRTPHRDNIFFWHDMRKNASKEAVPCPMDSEDPLFVLYTSGSTGTPKGLIHTTGGYTVQTTVSHRHVFKCEKDDVFWCTADVGWITGHSYTVYGALSNGITTVLYAGLPTHPTPSRYWDIIDELKVSVLYTAPTAIRLLKQHGDTWPEKAALTSLKKLGTVGEPISPEASTWYFEKIGKGKLPVVDTWWQTETGAIILSPDESHTYSFKPGSAGKALPGLEVVLLNEQHEVIEGEGEGLLAIASPWPSMARGILKNSERYKAYFQNGYYITGDGARRDKGGDYWLTGRIDDVLNVSGHRIGTAEIEGALAKHPAVSETAVVGFSHDLKGEGIGAFIALKEGFSSSELENALKEIVTTSIGALARPDKIVFVNALPKTRSGKIMRRILKQCLNGETPTGDFSTLANPEVLTELRALTSPRP